MAEYTDVKNNTYKIIQVVKELEDSREAVEEAVVTELFAIFDK